MKTYLSDQRIFLTSTPKLRSYHKKTILVIEQVHEWEGSVHVDDADPAHAGECSINIWAVNLPAMPGDNEAPSRPSPERARFGKIFLTQEAVDLISPNDDDPFCPLVLKIP